MYQFERNDLKSNAPFCLSVSFYIFMYSILFSTFQKHSKIATNLCPTTHFKFSCFRPTKKKKTSQEIATAFNLSKTQRFYSSQMILFLLNKCHKKQQLKNIKLVK
uniref:(northern house mosquito) hypothetical protein n=1 Tax=Culex pipiens TaxID=7175 RepID=A0A8D8APS7_CULPI